MVHFCDYRLYSTISWTMVQAIFLKQIFLSEMTKKKWCASVLLNALVYRRALSRNYLLLARQLFTICHLGHEVKEIVHKVTLHLTNVTPPMGNQ